EARSERTESFSRPQYDDYEDKAEDDMWDDDVEPDYNPPRINITEKKKERIPEYEDG
ncbi:MAG: photosystem reaction center subunit H, partial [Microcystis sp.]